MMHLLRRLTPAIGTVAFLISLSVVTLMLVGEGFKAFVTKSTQLTADGSKVKRDGSSTIFLKFPWSLRAPSNIEPSDKKTSADCHGECSGTNHLVAGSQDATTVVVPTFFPAYDFLSDVSLASSSVSSTALVCSVCLEPSSYFTMVPALVCPNITPTTCTVTETWHSTVYDCSKTDINIAAAFTVVVTANLPAGAPSYSIANMSSFTTSTPIASSTVISQLPITAGIPCSTCLSRAPDVVPCLTCVSSSSICSTCATSSSPSDSSIILTPSPTTAAGPVVTCGSGLLAKRQQDCVSAPTIMPTVVPTTAGSTPSFMANLPTGPTASIECGDGSLAPSANGCLSNDNTTASKLSSSITPTGTPLVTIIPPPMSTEESGSGSYSTSNYASSNPIDSLTSGGANTLTSIIGGSTNLLSDVVSGASGVVGTTLPIASEATGVVGTTLPIASEATGVVGTTLPIASEATGVVGTTIPIASEATGVVGTTIPIASEATGVIGTTLPIASEATSVVGTNPVNGIVSKATGVVGINPVISIVSKATGVVGMVLHGGSGAGVIPSFANQPLGGVITTGIPSVTKAPSLPIVTPVSLKIPGILKEIANEAGHVAPTLHELGDTVTVVDSGITHVGIVSHVTSTVTIFVPAPEPIPKRRLRRGSGIDRNANIAASSGICVEGDDDLACGA